jgi:four helix bundle protein
MKRKNPKSEIRGPKEIRRPEADLPSPEVTSAFWNWDAGSSPETFVLRENAAEAKPGRENLLERTARFGEAIIALARRVPQTPVTNRLIAQLVGAGTSVGANFCEADDAVSGREFKQKIGFCRKESKETMFFLRMVATAEPGLAEEARRLWREAKELNLIFGAIWRK